MTCAFLLNIRYLNNNNNILTCILSLHGTPCRGRSARLWASRELAATLVVSMALLQGNTATEGSVKTKFTVSFAIKPCSMVDGYQHW